VADEIDSLNAKLKQITLQRRQALNTYLDLKGKTLFPNLPLTGKGHLAQQLSQK
jgi:hypothetical protein